MTNLNQRASRWVTPTGYALTHCTKCKAGWTRYGEEGAVTVCLLDREPVLLNMTSCDRYEPKDSKQV